MRKTLLLAIPYFFLLAQGGIAQGIIEEESQNKITDVSGSTDGLPILIGQLGDGAQYHAQDINLVHIDQIGDRNTVYHNLHSNSGAVILEQYGSNNSNLLNITAKNTALLMKQRGSNNLIYQYGTYGMGEMVHQEVRQNGKGQNLHIHGGNSLSKDMKVTMQGNSQTIIIRNYN